MTDIIEAARLALSQAAEEIDDTTLWENRVFVAEAVLAAVTPLIRAAALEEAAKILEGDKRWTRWRAAPGPRIQDDIAAAIRALKPASPSPSDASA